ncbi:hypothetical protein CR513_37887, partial [Mucuna pruriens]
MPCPPFVKPLGNKFVFSIKLGSDGSIDQYGLNYDEAFAPVAKMTTMRTILALATSQSRPQHQMDVKNAFLHGDLKGEVYIKLPYGMHTPSPNIVYKQKHSLYGLIQAPKSMYDPSLFLQRTPKGIIVVLAYVDDIVVTGSDQ